MRRVRAKKIATASLQANGALVHASAPPSPPAVPTQTLDLVEKPRQHRGCTQGYRLERRKKAEPLLPAPRTPRSPAFPPLSFIFYPSSFSFVDLKDIKSIIDLMKKNDLSVFEMEKEGFKIRLKKGNSDSGGSYSQPGGPAPFYHTAPMPQATAAAAPATETAASATPVAKGPELVSPMVGTFYSAMSPDSPSYVKVGQTVTKDETVICIIEAMKVMNEIKADASGVVSEIVAENGKPVQFGQTLFRLQ